MVRDPSIGLNLQRLRSLARLTQELLAEHAGVSLDVVRKLEQGQRTSARIGTLRRLAAALDVDIAELVAPATGVPERTTADYLAGLIQHVRVLDDTSPTGTLVGLSRQLVALTETFLAAAGPAEQVAIGRRAAEAALLHWWLTSDAALDARAAGERTVALATEWGIPSIIGYLYAWRSGMANNAGDRPAATRLVRVARDPRWGLSAGGQAWAAAHEARVHVLAGRPELTVRAVDDAQTAYGAVQPADEPAWLYWMVDPILTLDRLDLALLRDGPDAVPALERALAGLAPDRVRDRAWYRARIAAARARAGDIEGATRDTDCAAELSVTTGTSWTMAELVQLAQQPHLGPVRVVLADHGLATTRS